jgi:hydroxypyruvate isomerase
MKLKHFYPQDGNPGLPSDKDSPTLLSRRNLLRRIGGGALALSAGLALPKIGRAEEVRDNYRVKNGRIKQSVIYWCFKPMTVQDLAVNAARMGMKSVELVTPEYWPALKDLGLICALAPSHGFAKGFAHQEEHAECLKILTQRIDECAAASFPSVITFSGFRRGLSDEEGQKNMVEGLKKIAGQAEKKKVNVCLEVLNSRVHKEMRGHPDYFSDKLEPAVEICKAIGSERIKILFDIYHIQIMEGDIITRIRDFHPYIAHYHTAGNPGRNEIDETQEINYSPIMKAIIETGYEGYVGQEFVPLRDKVASLNQAVKICDV